jgi:hypothetical protein
MGTPRLTMPLTKFVQRVGFCVAAAGRIAGTAVEQALRALVTGAVEDEDRLRVGLVRPPERHVDVLGPDHAHPDLFRAPREAAEIVELVHFVDDIPNVGAALEMADDWLDVFARDRDQLVAAEVAGREPVGKLAQRTPPDACTRILFASAKATT